MNLMSKKLYVTKPVYLRGGKIINARNSTKSIEEKLEDNIPRSSYDPPKFLKQNLNIASKNHSNVPPVMNSENHAEVNSILDFESKFKGRPKKNKNDNVEFIIK